MNTLSRQTSSTLMCKTFYLLGKPVDAKMDELSEKFQMAPKKMASSKEILFPLKNVGECSTECSQCDET